MDTAIWGPLMWQFINDVAVVNDEVHANLKNEEKDVFPKFVKHLKYMLPCRYCRESYSMFISKMPPSTSMIRWAYKIHNKVNKKLKRKTPIKFEKFQRRCMVYGGFGSSQHLWDLVFILALNFSPQKRGAYNTWFQWMGFVYSMLVKYRGYEDDEGLRHLWANYHTDVLEDKDSLLRYLSAHRPINSNVQDVSYWMNRYKYAFAYNDSEEMLRLCGPYG
jgi:hypothetical protein